MRANAIIRDSGHDGGLFVVAAHNCGPAQPRDGIEDTHIPGTDDAEDDGAMLAEVFRDGFSDGHYESGARVSASSGR